jgi:CheY-like chemotaxis protein
MDVDARVRQQSVEDVPGGLRLEVDVPSGEWWRGGYVLSPGLKPLWSFSSVWPGAAEHEPQRVVECAVPALAERRGQPADLPLAENILESPVCCYIVRTARPTDRPGFRGDGAHQMARVLVVDDEPDLRFVLRRLFERAGHEVVEAGDGAAALRSVEESRPDLVVTDIMMPVMDGAELIRRLRAEPTTATIPILSVSGDWQLAVGADAALAKPYDWIKLIAVSEDLLKERRDQS